MGTSEIYCKRRSYIFTKIHMCVFLPVIYLHWTFHIFLKILDMIVRWGTNSGLDVPRFRWRFLMLFYYLTFHILSRKNPYISPELIYFLNIFFQTDSLLLLLPLIGSSNIRYYLWGLLSQVAYRYRLGKSRQTYLTSWLFFLYS